MSRVPIFIFVISWALTIEYASAQPNRRFQLPDGIGDNYDPVTIMVKLDNPGTGPAIKSSRAGVDSRQKILRPVDLSNVTNAVSYQAVESPFKTPENGRAKPSKFLNDIYRVTLPAGADLELEINKLLRYDNVIYAEPVYMESQLLVPNDPMVGNQPHLGVVKAYDAWDIQQGNPDITVAIIDSGVDLDHPDLVDNMLTNPSDPVNGVDDDNDGLIDNFNGYDFADSDNDPSADRSGHGVLVTGLSSAATNNGDGVAGTGFNSTFVPYKIFRTSNNTSNNSYTAVRFAAEKGHQVMNLSWGATFAFSQFNQDIINSAVLEHDVVVIAAAGNDNNEDRFYPASYDNVLSVAATGTNDVKQSFSTFNYDVDLSAPGHNFTTKNGGTVGQSSTGTSFSAPLVAGAAALLRAEFPHWTARQVMEQLRVSADDVYDQGSNQTYFGKLGKGRLNMFNALKDTTYKSIRLSSLEYDNGFGQYAYYSDTLMFSALFENFLQPTLQASVSITSNSPYVSFLSGGAELGSMATLESTPIDSDLQLILSEDTPADEEIVIRFDYSDAGYSDWQFKTLQTSPDYFDMSTAMLDLTVVGNGHLGYGQDIQKNGIGFQLDGVPLMESMGIIISADGNLVDNSVNNFNVVTRNQDLSTVKNFRLFNNSHADLFGLSTMDDSNAGSEETGLLIEQKSLSWNEAADENYIILEYRVSNTSGSTINDLKLALFSDWLLINDDQNHSSWDDLKKLGYGIYELDSSLRAGVALLTDQTPLFYAIDKGSSNGNTSELGVTFSKSEKEAFISGGVGKTEAGASGGNDVAQLVGGELGTIADGESIKIAFALTAGDSLTMRNAVDQAKLRYAEFLANPPVAMIDTTCLDQATTISLDFGTAFDFYSDPEGTDLIHSGNDFVTGVLDKDTTFYVQNTDEAILSDIGSIRIKTNDIDPLVNIPDMYFLGDDPNNIVSFADNTFKSTNWQWDFDNGSGSSGQNPSSQYNTVGDYDVSVVIDDEFGCQALFEKTLSVRERGPAPVFEEYIVCQNQPVNISSVDSNNLRIYDSPTSPIAIAEGTIFNSGPINSDTVFYVSNIDPEFESVRVPVPVNIIGLDPTFQIVPDTTDLSKKNLIHLVNNTVDESSLVNWKVNGVIRSEESPTVDITGLNQFTVELTLSNSSGCENSKTEDITISTSGAPTSADIVVCPGQEVNIQPSGGNFFYFYSDENLSQLIHKGSYYKPENLETDTAFYVTGFDNLQESSATKIDIEFRPFSVDFEMTPNSLLLNSNNQVSLRDKSFGASYWKWYINDELVETVQNPVLTINSSGALTVKLVAESDEGCSLEKTRQLQINNVTSIGDVEQQIQLYPNPAKDRLFLNSSEIGSFEIYDLSGRLRLNGNVIPGQQMIDIHNLHPGIYAMRIVAGRSVVNRRILIE